MVIDLSIGATIMLLLGTHAFMACAGCVFGCCFRAAKKSDENGGENRHGGDAD